MPSRDLPHLFAHFLCVHSSSVIGAGFFASTASLPLSRGCHIRRACVSHGNPPLRLELTFQGDAELSHLPAVINYLASGRKRTHRCGWSCRWGRRSRSSAPRHRSSWSRPRTDQPPGQGRTRRSAACRTAPAHQPARCPCPARSTARSRCGRPHSGSRRPPSAAR